MLPWTKIYNILLVFFSPGSAETDSGCGGKLNGHLRVSCVRNIFLSKIIEI